MGLGDTKRAAISRHGADPEIRMRPGNRQTHPRVDGLDHANEPFGRDDGAERPHAISSAGRQGHGEFFAERPAVQRFRRDEAPAERMAEPQETTEAVVLGLQAGYEESLERDRIFAGGFLVMTNEGQAAELGILLERDERSHEVAAQGAGDRVAEPARQGDRDQGERATHEPQYGVGACTARNGAGHALSQLLRTDQYFSSSSRILPVPRTTHVRGSSSTWIGKLVS